MEVLGAGKAPAFNRADRALNYEAPPRQSGHKKLYAGGANGWEGGSRQPPVARSIGRPSLKAPQKCPIIQIVDRPAWLPEGWTAERKSGSKCTCYVDPVSQRRFRSRNEVNYFLQTGKSYRYKRNLALLTKPLKEDPVSLLNNKPYNKPGPKPKIKVVGEDTRRLFVGTDPKRKVIEERKPIEASQGQGTENKALALIWKLKRKTAETDEGQRNGKKPRLFEVVTPMHQPNSRSNNKVPPKRESPVDQLQKLALLTKPLEENRGKLILKFKRKTVEPNEGQRNGKKLRPFEVTLMTVKVPPKKESPKEQLQKLGRKLCQQAVHVLSSEYDSSGNTLQQVRLALHVAMSQHGLNGGFSTYPFQ